MKSDWKWDELDPRERRVAELLVQGKSNAAICAELFISRARVQDCIKRILIKTGAESTRSAIALLVAERETLSLLRVLQQATDGVVMTCPPKTSPDPMLLFNERIEDTGPKKGGISIGQQEAHG